ncbi:MAG: DUF3592 domain-containing protein [Elusimicrobiota bacterium]
MGSSLPDEITFSRVSGPEWRDPATAEWLAGPLREKGFVDLGVYAILPLTGFRLGVMFHERDKVAAFLCERPGQLGMSLELNVRYADGTTTMLINRADEGVPKPPFFRVIFDEPDISSGALHERLLRERSCSGIKAVTAETVIAEYQAAWTRMARWQKGDEPKSESPLWESVKMLVWGAAAICAILLGIFVLARFYAPAREDARFRRARTAQAEGTITEVRPMSRGRGGRTNSIRINVVFTTDSGKQMFLTRNLSGASAGVDGKIPVRYDPRNPSNNDVVWGRGMSGTTLDVLAWGGGFLLTGLVILFWKFPILRALWPG